MAMMPVCTGWLTDRRLMMPGAIFSTGINDVRLDRPLAVDRLAQHVHHAAQQPLADRHLEQAARGLDLGALGHFGKIAQQHAADLGFLEVQRQAEEAVGELDQLVEHDVAQAFDLRDAVAALPHDPGIGL